MEKEARKMAKIKKKDEKGNKKKNFFFSDFSKKKLNIIKTVLNSVALF